MEFLVEYINSILEFVYTCNLFLNLFRSYYLVCYFSVIIRYCLIVMLFISKCVFILNRVSNFNPSWRYSAKFT